ncbi:MAG: succinylglutamate desuccinylase/aspartoacylase family protein, partial [Acidimicrobiia bacterium]|nr:succinylglutamate desuccinylase/aspartoacylase family protein [Acidimicrobiia bacterium]
ELGIDLHTAASHRINAPQVRANLDDPDTRELAAAFGARFIIDARLRDGSVRAAATKKGIQVLLYEAGQIHRFDEDAIETGVNGVLRVLQAMEMGSWDTDPPAKTIEIRTTRWVRARRAGLMRLDATLGSQVSKGDVLGSISDALGNRSAGIKATMDGYVIAVSQNPLVSQGDALVHLAT